MYKKAKIIYYFSLIIFFADLAGCAPGPPPPPPPIFPGFEWLIIAIVIFLGIVAWKKYSSTESLKTDYLTETLNAINKQLKQLEKKIEQLEENQTKEHKKNQP